MERRRLAESDYKLMTVVWNHEPVSSMKLVDYCLEELGWKKSTTFTMLRKMIGKGYLKNENSVVTSILSRGEVQAAQSEIFVEQTFSGSLPGFLVAFLGGKTMSVYDGYLVWLVMFVDLVG